MRMAPLHSHCRFALLIYISTKTFSQKTMLTTKSIGMGCCLLYFFCLFGGKGLVARTMKDTEVIGKGKGKGKGKEKGVWVALLVMVMGMRRVSGSYEDYENGHNFNGKEHEALCSVFKASADVWEASKGSPLTLDKNLEYGVRQALFGTYDGKIPERITEGLPAAYNTHSLKYRGTRCGGCPGGDTNYFAGWSITHDLMCLCTPGYYSEPFYYWILGFIYRETGFRLCGRKREDMVPDQYQGWYSYNGYKQAKGLHSSWKAVVLGCYNNRTKRRETKGHNLEEKVKKLSEATQHFTTLLKQSGGRSKLGGFEKHHTESDGKDEKSMHVRYGACNDRRQPWWKKLNEALMGKKPQELIKRPSSASSGAGPAHNRHTRSTGGGMSISQEEGGESKDPGDTNTTTLDDSYALELDSNSTHADNTSTDTNGIGAHAEDHDDDPGPLTFHYLRSSSRRPRASPLLVSLPLGSLFL
ncbi:Variant surface glycoprotein [Trypanosoma congolense IL3000]|uniref:Variant surface glycoprotein n=1 Tax=Trypanosoma congolense (strain IL3000) TaxID=1068625 RepID=F9W3W4_TRYCI|nr:Variant surface glycoprotein [Trypanosoma congolense IL3000]